MATILILEDDLRLAAYWQQILEAEGHEVAHADTAPRASTLVTEIEPDLIITDMVIERDGSFAPQGGLSLLAKLSAPTQERNIPVIGVSGYKPRKFNKFPPLEIAKSMGVDIALYKPVTPTVLIAAVRQLLPQAAPCKDKESTARLQDKTNPGLRTPEWQ